MRLEGQQLDHYQIVSMIGGGGMGDVYLAEDSRIGQQVAIKVIRTDHNFYPNDLDALESARLLRREARAISQLDHPHILPLYNYGETQIGSAKLVYLVMPYRPEGSLADWVCEHYPTQLIPPKVVAYLIKQAAEALQVAHDHQIVHQDIKPSNFMIRTQANTSHLPELLLADFGIAHITASSASSSQSLGGTPLYMAPEQCEGRPVFASDQYALAVMAYELLTGHTPFQGNAVRLMYQHLTVTPAPPSTLQPQLPKELDAVLLKALQKRPEDRFASVTDFAVSLEQSIASPQPAPNIPKKRRHSLGKLRRGLIAASALLLLLLLLGRLANAYLGISPVRILVPYAPAAPLTTITITPASKDLKQTYTLSGVTGTPDANEQQVQAHQISANTQTSSTTVNATGQETTAGTNATGSLTITNDTPSVQTGYSAGNTFTGSSGVTVILDASTPSTLDRGASYTEPAHAATIGTAGNIPALDINILTNECRASACVNVTNKAAFTGGTNSGTYSVVQQSDIDTATNSLIASNQPDPQRVLQGQIRSNEQLVGTPQCQSNGSSNHQAGDKVAQVMVSVTFTCTGEVYDRREAQALSTTLLTHQVTTDLGTGYALVGSTKTAISNATLNAQGTVTITVTAEGVWAYQFSQEQQQNLAKLVAGKNKQVAIGLLQQQPGVSQVAIQFANGTGQTLPAKLEQIGVVVGSVPGA